MRILVELIPPLTLAPEAADGVHAGAVLARPRHQLALVNLVLAPRHRVDHAAGAAQAAQRPVGGPALHRADLAVLAPGRPHRTAADHPRLWPGHRGGAGPVPVLHVAGLFSHIDALLAVRRQHIIRRTFAGVAALRVDANTGVTEVRRLATLVDILAHHLIVAEAIAGLARAHEAAEGVAAPPVGAEAVHRLALVDVLQDDGLLVGLVAVAAGADELVVGGAGERALLTGRTPRLSGAAAAGRAAHSLAETCAADRFAGRRPAKVEVAGAFALVHAAVAAGQGFEARRADALVAALRVLTFAVHAGLGIFTFVDV